MVFMKQPSEITQLDELISSLQNIKTRGQIKRWGKWLERSALFGSFKELLSKKGLDVESCSGKQLIRLFLNRAQDSQQRSNTVHIDEGFVCAHCGSVVAPGVVQIRDHCPHCLYGLHLDQIPGDRASDCRGLMSPLYLESQGGLTWIHYRCSSCSHSFRVRSHRDDELLKFAQQLGRRPPRQNGDG